MARVTKIKISSKLLGIKVYEFASILRKWREPISRVDLAEVAQVRKSVICAIEHGDVLNVRVADIYKIIDALIDLHKIRSEQLETIKRRTKELVLWKQTQYQPVRQVPHKRQRPVRRGLHC